jgi:lipopolysaccharide export system permease protein
VSLLSRYAVWETASHAGGGFAVVLAIFLTTRLGDLLADAAVGSLPGGVIAELLALRTVMALPSLLPAVLYLGVLLGLSRLSRDHELTALEACGVAPHRVHRAILWFAAAVSTVVAFLSFNGRPWAAASFNGVRDQAVAQAGLDNLTPGRFYETDAELQEVVFAESRSPSEPQYLENVFVQRRTAKGITVYTAERVRETRDGASGFRFLLLLDGAQYDLDPEGRRQEITRYQSLTLRSPIRMVESDLGAEKTLSARALFRSGNPKDSAELQWRAAMPVSALLLSLLAIPLGHTDPRRGRYANIFPAVLLYIAYRYLLGMAKNWVADGTLPELPGVWLVHGAFLVLAVVSLRYHRRVAQARTAG